MSKHIIYDREHGFDLLDKIDTTDQVTEARVDRLYPTVLNDHSHDSVKITLFVSVAKGICFGAAVGWVSGNRSWTKSTSLGRYLTVIDAKLFAICMAVQTAQSLLLKTAKRCAVIMSDSHRALSVIDRASHWATPAVRDVKDQIRLIHERGGRVILSRLHMDETADSVERVKAAAQHAATQEPKAMRSPSLSYAMLSTKARWKPEAKVNKAISDGKKLVTARYLQLKSDHAVTGVDLLRTEQAQDARCWWCDSSSQTVAHLLMECRKWRRECDVMLKDVQRKKIKVSARRNTSDLQLLFHEDAAEAMFRFLDHTAVGKRREEREAEAASEMGTNELSRLTNHR